MPIEMIAFDADDTLWENETRYRKAQETFQDLMSPWSDPETIHAILYEIEIRNLPRYGYGIKAFCLSLIEAAIAISDGEVRGDQIGEILNIARGMLQAEVTLRPHVKETLSLLAKKHRLMVITKGDLLDQTTKLERSGLENVFEAFEVLNHKTRQEYAALLNRHRLAPEGFVMIGNSLRSDILPVLELGGRAVYVPAGTNWAHEHVEDFDKSRPGFFEVAHLGQLPALIEEKTNY
jgi:putative hydrolase of the HAD superfamily